MAAGLKPLLRSTLTREQARDVLSRYRHLRLHGLIVDDPVRPGGVLLYLGFERARVLAAAKADQTKDDRELGRLLGYPRCCVDAYQAIPEPRSTATVQYERFATFTGRGYHRLNGIDLHVFHYVPWFPCSPTCDLSRRYADAVATCLPILAPRVAQLPEDVDLERFVSEVDDALAAHRLHALGGVQVSLDGQVSDEALQVRAAWATAADRPPSVRPSSDEANAVACLLRLLRVGCSVRVAADTLFVDGVAVVQTPYLFLASFDRRA